MDESMSSQEYFKLNILSRKKNQLIVDVIQFLLTMKYLLPKRTKKNCAEPNLFIFAIINKDLYGIK
jgi:hypothetical protein